MSHMPDAIVHVSDKKDAEEPSNKGQIAEKEKKNNHKVFYCKERDLSELWCTTADILSVKNDTKEKSLKAFLCVSDAWCAVSVLRRPFLTFHLMWLSKRMLRLGEGFTCQHLQQVLVIGWFFKPVVRDCFLMHGDARIPILASPTLQRWNIHDLCDYRASTLLLFGSVRSEIWG